VHAQIDKEFTPFLYEAPNPPEQPATLCFIALGSAGKGSRIIDVLVDPVSLDLVTWHYDAFWLRCQKFIGLGTSNPSCIISVMKNWRNPAHIRRHQCAATTVTSTVSSTPFQNDLETEGR
jgi:hypothetical protein